MATEAPPCPKLATGSPKLNYEIHGNTIPHLHLHLLPRYPGDPYEGSPIDPRSGREFERTEAELAVLRAAIEQAAGPEMGRQSSHSPSRMIVRPRSSFASRQAWIRTGRIRR
jgi:hypothetical protein